MRQRAAEMCTPQNNFIVRPSFSPSRNPTESRRTRHSQGGSPSYYILLEEQVKIDVELHVSLSIHSLQTSRIQSQQCYALVLLHTAGDKTRLCCCRNADMVHFQQHCVRSAIRLQCNAWFTAVKQTCAVTSQIPDTEQTNCLLEAPAIVRHTHTNTHTHRPRALSYPHSEREAAEPLRLNLVHARCCKMRIV